MNGISVPETVGLIMDGNGRWALQQNKSRLEGHTKGIVNMMTISAYAFDCGVKNMVCYGLSTENLKRAAEEVHHIYDLVIDAFGAFVSLFSEKRACVKFIGDLGALPEEVKASMRRSEEALRPFEGMGRTIYIAIAYGSRNEIVRAVNAAVERGEKVTEESFLKSLSMPCEPELIIRTGGEMRLSNFLLYQSSYSELYFTPTLFPDFSKEDLDEAFAWYATRKRRFGLT